VKQPPPEQDGAEPPAAYLALANGHYDAVTRFALVEVSRRGGGSELTVPVPKKKPGQLKVPGTVILGGLAVLFVVLGGLLVSRLV
jgi:hypothetical protein